MNRPTLPLGFQYAHPSDLLTKVSVLAIGTRFVRNVFRSMNEKNTVFVERPRKCPHTGAYIQVVKPAKGYHFRHSDAMGTVHAVRNPVRITS